MLEVFLSLPVERAQRSRSFLDRQRPAYLRNVLRSREDIGKTGRSQGDNSGSGKW